MKCVQSSWNVNHQKIIDYNIYSTEDVFQHSNETILLDSKINNSNRFVVVDNFIYNLYNNEIRRYFSSHGINCKIVPFDSDEKNKNLESFINLFKELDNFPIDRRSEPIIAIGGGVVTDVVGFVASCYRRGVPHIKIPTTLMGYIDASIGIKTGINFDSYKNRMGSFEPPKSVILDRRFLQTLPERHILNGVGEILKIAVIKDYNLFETLEEEGLDCINTKFQTENGAKILDTSITDMLEELEPNLYEDNLERCVDFGHTFSLALEMSDIDNLLHGEAVSIDIAFSTILSKVHSLISESEADRVLNLIKKLNLPYYHDSINPDLLWNSLIERTYHRDGLQRVPLPYSIGKYTFVNDITYDEISKTCEILKSYCLDYCRL